MKNEEREVIISGISLSPTGFKNLQFETSRSSNRTTTIRGFGSNFREENLKIIETVRIEMVLTTEELKQLSFIYCLFKANGALPVVNEYLVNKIKSTYLVPGSKSENKINNNSFLKDDVKAIICFLQSLNIRSLPKTSNGYSVNLILSLHDSCLNNYEYSQYLNIFNDWKKNHKKFVKTCTENIANSVQQLKEFNPLEIRAYNIEALNSLYQENLIDLIEDNNKLKFDSVFESEKKAQEQLDKISIRMRKKYGDDYDYKKIGTTITVPNKNILQLEFVTNNKISALPIKGNPVKSRSYLGIGDSFFTVKMIFNEYDSEILEKLKNVSDKNIINHKIELDHPLSKIFDFHTGTIMNIVFNNVEEANGIMVDMIFSLNGFRYEPESYNGGNTLEEIIVSENTVLEDISGLYLEYVSDFLLRNKDKRIDEVYQFLNNVLETKSFGNEGQSSKGIFTELYYMSDFLSSYSSIGTSYSYFKTNRELIEMKKDFNNAHYDFIMEELKKDEKSSGANYDRGMYLYNASKEIENDKTIQSKSDNIYSSTVELNEKTFRTLKEKFDIDPKVISVGHIFKNAFKDSALFSIRDFDFGKGFYSMIDNLSAVFIISPYETGFNLNKKRSAYIDEVVAKLIMEMFNPNQNGDNDIFRNELYKQLYCEFFLRLPYILSVNLREEIQKIKESSFINGNGEIQYCEVKNTISNILDKVFALFESTLSDSVFLKEITDYLINHRSPNEATKDLYKKQDKETIVIKNVKEFASDYKHKLRRNKNFIKDRTYNIFLTKLTYLLSVASVAKIDLSEAGTEYEYARKKFKRTDPFLEIESYIKIYILSSALYGFLLLQTETRTDHFGNNIIVGMKNIGVKIADFSYNLKKTIKNKDGQDEFLDKMFYEMFSGAAKNNSHFYYSKKVNYNDLNYVTNLNQKFKSMPNKDINFFYGHKFQLDPLYEQLSRIIVPSEIFIHKENMHTMLAIERNNFFKNYKSDNKKGDDKYYSKSDIKIYKETYPLLHDGRIPSYFSEEFYDKDGFMSTRMKQRVIGNIDPFTDLERISDIIYDIESAIVPDYELTIYKYSYDDRYTGNAYRLLNEKAKILIKNISAVSVTKNPKTKIKVAKITITDNTNSIFNFNKETGSFDMKTLSSGNVEVIRFEVGDSAILKVGYSKHKQIFNGIISKIEINGNIINLVCSSYASGLYGTNIDKIKVSSYNTSLIEFFKTIFNSTKGTLDKINIDTIKNSIANTYGSHNPNWHLFDKFYKDIHSPSINVPFQRGKYCSTMSVAIMSVLSLPSRVLSNFLSSEIQKGVLASSKYAKAVLRSTFGSMKVQEELIGENFTTTENFYNIDEDYEVYGMGAGINYNPGSIDHGKNKKAKNEDVKNEDAKNKNIKNKNKNVKNEAEKEQIVETKKNENETNDDNKYSPGINYQMNYLPVPDGVRSITSLFKEIRDSGNTHYGIDIAGGDSNTPIYAVNKGRVISSGHSTTKGNYVEIEHIIYNSEGEKIYYQTGYFHLNEIRRGISNGSTVLGNEIIGYMGNTGSSTGVHLHFEIKDKRGRAINPFDIDCLPKADWKIVWGKVNKDARNGQYTELWEDKYNNSPKQKAYLNAQKREGV